MIGQVTQYALENLNLTGNQLLVYLFIARKSFGYGNSSCKLDRNEIPLSKPTVISALAYLEEKKYIERLKNQEVGPKQVYGYRIKLLNGMPYIKLKKSKKDEENELNKAFDEWDKTISFEEKQKYGNLKERFEYFKQRNKHETIRLSKESS